MATFAEKMTEFASLMATRKGFKPADWLAKEFPDAITADDLKAVEGRGLAAATEKLVKRICGLGGKAWAEIVQKAGKVHETLPFRGSKAVLAGNWADVKLAYPAKPESEVEAMAVDRTKKHASEREAILTGLRSAFATFKERANADWTDDTVIKGEVRELLGKVGAYF